MRNLVTHSYFQVDYAIVWNTIQNALPEVERKVLRALKDFTEGFC